jgi:VanZ family protein
VFRLLAVVVALILYGTLSPFEFDFSRHSGRPLTILLHSWPAKFDRATMRDAVVNIAVYLPLGAVALLAFARRHRPVLAWGFAVMLAAALSASVEMLQIYDAYRYASALDWICNVAGAATGAMLAIVYRRRIEAGLSIASHRSAPGALLLAACWAGAQAYPLVPLINFGRLRVGIAQLAASHLATVEVIAGAAGWFVFALTLRAVRGRLAIGWLALTMLVLPARLFIVDRALTKSDLIAGAIALLLWGVIPDRARQGVGWLLLIVAILLRELAPFNFTTSPHAFSWIPFAATLAAERTASVAVFLRKAFEYGAMIWLLRAGKIGYWKAGIAVAAALAVLEAMQCWLPGRQAEITDALLALIMALVLKLLDSGRSPKATAR